MNGGACEYVSAYYTGGDSKYLSSDIDNKEYAGVLYINRNTKYVEPYDTAYAADNTGDAVYETSSEEKSWDGDTSAIPSNIPIFDRGGDYYSRSSSGIFNFSYGDGTVSSGGGTFRSFRAVLSIK